MSNPIKIQFKAMQWDFSKYLSIYWVMLSNSKRMEGSWWNVIYLKNLEPSKFMTKGQELKRKSKSFI